jgi:putative DNA primase/helicase
VTETDSGAAGGKRLPLLEHHASHLRGSAISDEVIRERRYQSIHRDSNASREMRDKLKRAGIPRWARDVDARYPGLLIPLYRATGERIAWQYRPDNPPTVAGKVRKYAAQVGRASVLDVHPRNRDRIIDPGTPLWITEGIKKGDALTTAGACAVTLSGVFNWRSQLGSLGDWEDVLLRGRTVYVCFDADATTNRNVAAAMSRLGKWLRSKGAGTVVYVVVPDEVNGQKVKGADDYLAAGGTLQGLTAAGRPKPPQPPSAADRAGVLADSVQAEITAAEALDGRFRWCAGMGWLEWDETRWVEQDEAVVLEVVRCHLHDQFVKATANPNTSRDEIDVLKVLLTAGKIRNVTSLTRGMEGIHTKAAAFDAHPDLLNTPDGVVDLRTGEVRPHDSNLLLTKITSGSYRPGFTHPDWDKALQAVPSDVRDWLQVRFGQAVTGHTTPDGRMLLLQGGGENGKGAVTTDGVVPAVGDYAAMASHKLFMAGKGSEHSTERADLRGQRLLIAEELTEGRSIDVTALKQISDVGRIKARKVHKDNMEFDASHSLFTTTNYVPVVNETDHGTWRRLALVRFPYTFRKPGEPLVDERTDRRGDPTLKGRIKANVSGQHDAIVTWVVEGAVRWYVDQERITAELTAGAETAASVLDPPPTVRADTLAWRAEADRVLGFWLERLVPDREACIVATELLAAFNDWLKDNGHQAWSKETFGPRFEQHSETTRNRVCRRRTAALAGVSRYLGSTWSSPPELPKQAHVWQGLRFRAADDVECPGCGKVLAPSLVREGQAAHAGCVMGAGSGTENGPDQHGRQELAEVADPSGKPPIRSNEKEFSAGRQPRQVDVSGASDRPPACRVCGGRLDTFLAEHGADTHPTCDPPRPDWRDAA